MPPELTPRLEGRAVQVVDVDTSAYEALFKCLLRRPQDTAPTDLAWIFSTSGTTCFPKGAML